MPRQMADSTRQGNRHFFIYCLRYVFMSSGLFTQQGRTSTVLPQSTADFFLFIFLAGLRTSISAIARIVIDIAPRIRHRNILIQERRHIKRVNRGTDEICHHVIAVIKLVNYSAALTSHLSMRLNSSCGDPSAASTTLKDTCFPLISTLITVFLFPIPHAPQSTW